MSEAYCMKCKSKQPISNIEHVTTANGAKAMKGNCSKCNGNVYAMVKSIKATESKKSKKMTKSKKATESKKSKKVTKSKKSKKMTKSKKAKK